MDRPWYDYAVLEAQMALLTANGLRTKWSGRDRWLFDGAERGHGALVARIMRPGVAFYFQYVNSAGKKRLLPMGSFDVDGKRGLSLMAARGKAAGLSQLYRSGMKDLHEYLEQRNLEEEVARQQEKEDAERERQAREDAANRYSLKKLLGAYVGHLRASGKVSADDVENIFENHVLTNPELPHRLASEVSIDDWVGIVGKVVAAGHGRTAAKLRSYARAAYELAIRSKTDPAAPQGLKEFGIKFNPLASISALAQYNKALDRNLSAPEFAAFLQRVHAAPIDAKRDALEVCIYTGGQRPTQLLRLRRSDINLSAGTITLYDRKGKRLQPRVHIVPLIEPAADILRRRLANLVAGEPVFSTDGRAVMDRGTLTNFVTEISRQMVEAKEVYEPFTLRDIRRTLETLMASWGVSTDARKHVQSHGLSGVQHRHYDKYGYMPEKQTALKTSHLQLRKLLDRPKQEEEPTQGRKAILMPELKRLLSNLRLDQPPSLLD